MSRRPTHCDESGRLRMVDVGGKDITHRTAVAEAVVTVSGELFLRITQGELAKGDLFAAARLAGIQAAKRTAELIPLCHPLPLSHVELEITPDADSRTLTVRCETAAEWRTGVEMEALTGACVAALTIYDMGKAVDRGIVIGPVRLIYKSGGKGG